MNGMNNIIDDPSVKNLYSRNETSRKKLQRNVKQWQKECLGINLFIVLITNTIN